MIIKCFNKTIIDSINFGQPYKATCYHEKNISDHLSNYYDEFYCSVSPD